MTSIRSNQKDWPPIIRTIRLYFGKNTTEELRTYGSSGNPEIWSWEEKLKSVCLQMAETALLSFRLIGIVLFSLISMLEKLWDKWLWDGWWSNESQSSEKSSYEYSTVITVLSCQVKPRATIMNYPYVRECFNSFRVVWALVVKTGRTSRHTSILLDIESL